MADLDIVGGAAVDVTPIVPNFHNKLKALVLPIADKVGEEAGKRMGQAIADNLTIAIPDGINQGGKAAKKAAIKQGSDTGGAFARSIRTKLEAAFKAMPKLDVKLSDTGVDAELARIRAKLEDLSNKRVGVDISAEDAEAQIVHLEEQLRRLGAEHPNVAVRADTATARAALAEIRAEIASIPGRREVGLEVDGAFGEKLRAVVAQAQASLPEINVDADTSPARAEVQQLRAELATLADARVGIDIDAGEALAEIAAIQTRLEVLSIKHLDIDVRVDAARAAAELAALSALADDTKIFHIRALADTSQASGALLNLGIQIVALAALPAVPVALAGLGGIAAMATAAAAGVGALAIASIPAIKGVTEALAAKKAAQDEDASSTTNGAKSNVQAAQRALQMASAQDALSTAHRSAARSIAQANKGVADAERAVAQASQRAADQRSQAAEAVERAEKGLADAQKDARRAELDLTQARKDAAQQLKDLNRQLADGALDQREATLRVQQAELDLQATLKDPKASEIQRAQAQLTYDQAVQHAKEQKDDYAALQKTAAEQTKAGIAGNKGVQDAAQRVADAQSTVREQTEGVAKAQKDAARAQADAAQTVADAQRGLADAVQAAADARVDAAQSIESAERGVQSAQLSGIDTTVKAATAQDKYREALAKLSRPQRELFNAIAGPHGIKSAFDDWQKSLQGTTLPLFTRLVDGAKNSLPGLTPLVTSTADAIGSLMDRASAQLKTPFWKGFKDDLDKNVRPAVEGFGIAFGNVIKGTAGIIDAFLPHMGGIVKASDRITGRFAKWGSSLKGSPDFEKFLQYVKDTSPGLAEFVGKIFRASLDTAKALGPASQAMMAVVGPLFDAISWLAVHAPGFVLVLWGLYAATKAVRLGMAAFAIAMGIYEVVIAGATLVTSGFAAAVQATGIVPVIEAIVLAVILLAAGLVYAYRNWGWFRAAVDGAAKGIKIAVLAIWDYGLKPALDGIQFGLKAAGDGATWLWGVLSPVFGFIGKASQILFTAMVTLLLLPAYVAFKALAAIASWLWVKYISPIFGWIGDKSKWLYDKAFKPSFNAIRSALSAVGSEIARLWSKYASPIFGWIGDKAKWLYDKAIKPPFDKVRSAMGLVSDSFAKGRDDIKKAWDEIRDITRKPVRWIVDHVYNRAIVPLWSKVAAITGAKDLKKIDLDSFATGGVAHGVRPGYTPGRDNQIIAVGGGEAIMRPEFTRAAGEDTINRWNAIARTGGVNAVRRALSGGMPAFADGGVVSWLKDKTSDVGKFFGGALDYFDPTKLFDKAKNFVTDQMKPILENPWAKNVAKIPVKILTSLKDKATDFFNAGGGGGGGGDIPGSGVQRWAPVVLQALKLVGQPAGLLQTVLRRMNQESGGNPRAINNWDINAKNGDPSRGLMQTIGSTFNAYAGPYRSRGIYDPLANIYASMKYAMSRYGSLASAYNRPGGYDSGGMLQPGWTPVFNGTGGPERVLTNSQWDALRAAANRPAASTQLQADVHVYVGDREITDIVRTEIVAHDDATASAIDTGRRL